MSIPPLTWRVKLTLGLFFADRMPWKRGVFMKISLILIFAIGVGCAPSIDEQSVTPPQISKVLVEKKNPEVPNLNKTEINSQDYITFSGNRNSSNPTAIGSKWNVFPTKVDSY